MHQDHEKAAKTNITKNKQLQKQQIFYTSVKFQALDFPTNQLMTTKNQSSNFSIKLPYQLGPQD